MDIYQYIIEDHEKVDALFSKILAAKGANRKLKLFEELKLELLTHADSEHKTLYKTLKKHENIKDKIAHADKEHADVKKRLKELSRLSMQEATWMEKLQELKEVVEHHVKEEEEDIFTQAKQVLNEEKAIDLTESMIDSKLKYLAHG